MFHCRIYFACFFFLITIILYAQTCFKDELMPLRNKSLMYCFQVRDHLSAIQKAAAGLLPVCLNCSDINGKCFLMFSSL